MLTQIQFWFGLPVSTGNVNPGNCACKRAESWFLSSKYGQRDRRLRNAKIVATRSKWSQSVISALKLIFLVFVYSFLRIYVSSTHWKTKSGLNFVSIFLLIRSFSGSTLIFIRWIILSYSVSDFPRITTLSDFLECLAKSNVERFTDFDEVE